MSDAALTIGDLVERTGVSEAALRVWERRHGFPAPERLPSGHRRYREADVHAVLQVQREREAGFSLAVAIGRARAVSDAPGNSIFAGLRRIRPELQPIRMRKPLLLALSRGLEDESCARAERPLLFAAFQRERFYRQSESRWREFARTAELAVVFADFERRRAPAGAPVEVPLDRSGPLTREWAIVCEARGHASCLAGLELTPARPVRDHAREFDVIWSVEPEVVHAAVELCLRTAGLDDRPAPPSPAPLDQLRLAAAITTRTLGALS